MLESRSQKPISPQQMFNRLLEKSYKESQCEQDSQRIKKKRLLLIELIAQYEQSIHSQIVKINQIGNLQKLRLQKIQELSRLKKERQIIETSVHEELSNISITPNQHQEKSQLISQLQQVKIANNQVRLKLKDLQEYIAKLQLHNQRLASQKDIISVKAANRLRINSQDWKSNIECFRKKQQLEENHIKAKILQKESENIKKIRRQEEQIYKRNQQKWDEFKKTVFKPKIDPIYSQKVGNQNIGLGLRRQPERLFQRFRVI